MEGTVNISDFIKYLEDHGFVIAPREYVKQQVLKEKILRKKWITQKEIADSKIWGVDKGAVKVIVKGQIDQDCINKTSRPFRIHRSEVERIAKNRGII